MKSKAENQAKYLKTGKAAVYLGVSRRYLSQLARSGRIRSAKLGPRTVLFLKSDLDAFFDRNAAGGVE